MNKGSWAWTLAVIGLLLAFIGGIMWAGQRIDISDRGPAITFVIGIVVFMIFGFAAQMYDQGIIDYRKKRDESDNG